MNGTLEASYKTEYELNFHNIITLCILVIHGSKVRGLGESTIVDSILNQLSFELN